MKLTGKCKNDFESWFRQKRATFNFRWWMLVLLDEQIKNALIIEFLDAKKIFIGHWGFIDYVEGEKDGFDCSVNFMQRNIFTENTFYYTRLEAENKAIERANELYNSLS